MSHQNSKLEDTVDPTVLMQVCIEATRFFKHLFCKKKMESLNSDPSSENFSLDGYTFLVSGTHEHATPNQKNTCTTPPSTASPNFAREHDYIAFDEY